MTNLSRQSGGERYRRVLYGINVIDGIKIFMCNFLHCIKKEESRLCIFTVICEICHHSPATAINAMVAEREVCNKLLFLLMEKK